MSALFNGISEKEKNKLFTLLHTHVYTFEDNINIIPTIRNTNIIGIVDEGSIEFTKTNYYGDTTLIEVLEKDDIFGTSISSLYNNEVELITKGKTTVIIIDFKRLMKEENISKSYYNIFIQNLFTILNEKIKDKNDRISILTNKTIRNRLLEYFNSNHKKRFQSKCSETSDCRQSGLESIALKAILSS